VVSVAEPGISGIGKPKPQRTQRNTKGSEIPNEVRDPYSHE
jgi:hypothetical protein